MTNNFTAIADELYRRLAGIRGLNVGIGPQSGVPMPTALVLPPTEVRYRRTAGPVGIVEPVFRIWLLVADTITEEATRLLFEFVDPTSPLSIQRAVEGDDRTLGGLVDDCVVLTCRNLEGEEVALIQAWGYEFTLTIAARRNDA
jgi:hypothetical protein